jgi:hypothetical protein
VKRDLAITLVVVAVAFTFMVGIVQEIKWVANSISSHVRLGWKA